MTHFLICARGGSKGIKDKNLKSIKNQSLILRAINFAKKFKGSKIYLSSDSEKIIDVGKNNTIYNVGNAKEPISIINLAKKIIKMSKLKKTILRNVKFEDSDRTATREIYKRIPCINLISSHTNYKPRISIEMGIKEILRKNKILK